MNLKQKLVPQIRKNYGRFFGVPSRGSVHRPLTPSSIYGFKIFRRDRYDLRYVYNTSSEKLAETALEAARTYIAVQKFILRDRERYRRFQSRYLTSSAKLHKRILTSNEFAISLLLYSFATAVCTDYIERAEYKDATGDESAYTWKKFWDNLVLMYGKRAGELLEEGLAHMAYASLAIAKTRAKLQEPYMLGLSESEYASYIQSLGLDQILDLWNQNRTGWPRETNQTWDSRPN
ncbi:hypothetical protein AA313_de0202565 [Arthrobotrys entomopaga]|nr:hypothetical protein AA313_de0202565 [Arthrobotrys entomopaga]